MTSFGQSQAHRFSHAQSHWKSCLKVVRREVQTHAGNVAHDVQKPGPPKPMNNHGSTGGMDHKVVLLHFFHGNGQFILCQRRWIRAKRATCWTIHCTCYTTAILYLMDYTLKPAVDHCSASQRPLGSVPAMFWRLSFLAVSAGLLFGVDLASIGAALEGMSQVGCGNLDSWAGAFSNDQCYVLCSQGVTAIQ